MWQNTASAEENKCLLLHRCLFSHVVGKWKERQMQVYAETKRYRCSENCSVPSCKKNCVCVAFLLIPMLGKRVDELYFLRSYRPHQKELGPLFTLFYHRLIYKQGTIRRRISRKIETKRRCCANCIRSDSNVTTHMWVTVFITWSLLICLMLQSVDTLSTGYLWNFMESNHSSVHLWRM